MNLKYQAYKGADIRQVFKPLALLRIAVFRDFPYLYDGSLEYEQNYLETYAASERALLFAVFDHKQMVGATTCIPLSEETEEVQAPFKAAGLSLSEVFYFGESILLPGYRGKGLGHRFFEVREAHAAGLGTFRVCSFCAVERPIDHPLRPRDYRPLDAFWLKRGYRKAPQLTAQFFWPDLGAQISTPKTMVYWTRSI